MRISTLRNVVLSITAALTASSGASAGLTSYPGTGCVHGLILTPKVVYQNSRASNVSTSSSTFYCPAVQQGGAVTASKVYGDDQHPAASVSCHAIVSDPFDQSASFSATKTSGAALTGNFTLDLGAVVTPPAFTFGSKVIKCTLPVAAGSASSSITSYSITEG